MARKYIKGEGRKKSSIINAGYDPIDITREGKLEGERVYRNTGVIPRKIAASTITSYFNIWYEQYSTLTDMSKTDVKRYWVAGFKGALKNSGEEDNLEEATHVSEGFHGRPTRYIEDVIEIEKYRTKLAHLGDLVEFEILDKNGKHVIPISFPEHDSEEHVSVGSTPDRCQIILSGGDQSIDLEAFEDLSENEKRKDYVCIGEVFSISYFSDKHHLEGPGYQKDGTEYIHKFGEEEGGERPYLMYDRLNDRMILIGGSYEIRDEGIFN